MMNSGSSSSDPAVDRSNESQMDLDSWINELLADNCSDSVVNSGVDAMTLNPSYPRQPNITTINRGTTLGGGSANKSQSGVAHEMMTVSSLSSTATLQRSGDQMLSAAPNFIPDPVAQSSRLCNLVRPTQALQHQPLRQQVFKNKAVQQPQTHSLTEQPNILFGQTGHLQNQQALRLQSNTSQLQQQQPQILQPMQMNKQQLQFQQPTGSTAHNLMSADGRHRFQGFMIREGQRMPQEQQQGNIPDALSAPVGLLAPSEFPTVAAWNEYAFQQILQMKERYMTELQIMHRNAKNFHVQETNMDAPNKYAKVTVFLEKMIIFLNTPTVDAIPKNSDRLYSYMKFIIDYINSFRNKNGGSSQQRVQVNQQPVHQPPSTTSSQSKWPQLQPSGGMKLQFNPQPSLSHGVPTVEYMGNFNQNFPSRWPPARTPNTAIEQRPLKQLRIGSFKAAQPNVVGTTQQTNSGPKTSSGTINMSGSTMGLLATTTTANFPSRQLNNQPALANEKFNLGKLKQPMHKVNELPAESRVGQMMSPLGCRLLNQFQSPQFSLSSAAKPFNQQAASPVSSWHPVSSSRVDANIVLASQSIGRSPFLLATSSQPKQRCSLNLSSLSTAESKNPETPIMPGQFGDRSTITNQIPDMGAPTTPPTTSSMHAAPTKEKSHESQDLKDPHTRLIEAVKSLSSKALSSSLKDICSAKKVINSIPDDEPTNPVGPYIEKDANFVLKYDNEQEQKNNRMLDGEPTNLVGPNIEDGSDFLLEYENEQERKVRRKLSITSMDRSSLHSSDHDSLGEFVCEEWDMDSTITSTKKSPKIECKNGVMLEEVKEINSELLETSLHIVLDAAEGTIVKCFYRNVCCPQLLTLQEAEKTSGFHIQLFVPDNYPASSPAIINSGCNISSGPWAKLYKEIVTRFKRALRGIPEQLISLGDMARNWDACARAVITGFAERRGAKSFRSTYGSWETCINSSSGSK